jgi:hypothetical protein
MQICTSDILAYASIYYYILVYVCQRYLIANNLENRGTNLRVHGMKAPFRHIKGIASGTHFASEKPRPPFTHPNVVKAPLTTWAFAGYGSALLGSSPFQA